MTVAIILFTQLPGAINYPCDTRTFISLSHRPIKTLSALTFCCRTLKKHYWIHAFLWSYIIFFSSGPNPPSHDSLLLYFSTDLRTDVSWSRWKRNGASRGVQEGRNGEASWEGLGTGDHLDRAETEDFPMFPDTDGWEENDVTTDKPHLPEKTVNIAINLKALQNDLSVWNTQIFPHSLSVFCFIEDFRRWSLCSGSSVSGQ